MLVHCLFVSITFFSPPPGLWSMLAVEPTLLATVEQSVFLVAILTFKTNQENPDSQLYTTSTQCRNFNEHLRKILLIPSFLSELCRYCLLVLFSNVSDDHKFNVTKKIIIINSDKSRTSKKNQWVHKFQLTVRTVV